MSSFTTTGAAQQGMGSLRGRVKDEFDRLILTATVVLIDETGKQRNSRTSSEGFYQFNNLAPGSYRLTARAPGFAQYRNESFKIVAGRQNIQIRLGVTFRRERVTVPAEAPLGIEPEENADAIVLYGSELDAFPEDAESIQSALNALVGPTAGQDDREVIVDGFKTDRVPAKQTIREVRIGQNPFSAEFERMGEGRIEISTKPGTDSMRSGMFFNFNDHRLNSRNPFASNHTPFQLRHYGANISGPLGPRRATIYLNSEWREADENAVVNATVLNDALDPMVVNRSILTPQRSFNVTSRIDYQLTPDNTLVVRYGWARTAAENEGIGDFSLPERAYRARTSEHVIQLTERAILRSDLLLETRFQLALQQRVQQGDKSVPTVRVLDAFTGGGPQVGHSFSRRKSWELHEHALWASGGHTIRFGGRMRGVEVMDVASANFGGTYTFGGGSAVRLDEEGQVLLADGSPLFESITSLERYRRTLLFLRHGLPDNRGALTAPQLGFGPTQFSIAGGNPEASVGVKDSSLFIQDDWRLGSNLNLNFGLRYESQTNLNRGPDLAPRAGFAWSPQRPESQAPLTVIRGGFGIFYQRFSESYTLQQKHFDGTNQLQFIVTDPRILELFPQVPSVEDLTGFSIPLTRRRIAPDIRAPYSLQSSLSIERRLPFNSTLSLGYLNSRAFNILRSRNINAPLPGTYMSGVRASGVRPLGTSENIFQYESSGRSNQHQVRSTLNSRVTRSLAFLATYVWTRARSDTDRAGTFPADSYDLNQEYGRSLNDVRHHFSLTGTLNIPWAVRFSPFIVATSGRPFNIITGRDSNGDTLFTERPAFANSSSSPQDIVSTRWGSFDTSPRLGHAIIPRNHGTGPGLFLVNLRGSRTFRLGEGVRTGSSRQKQKDRKTSSNWLQGRDYVLTLSVQIQNLFNTTNPGPPSGNLRSTYFGLPNSLARGYGFGGSPSAANRRIELQLQLNF